MGWRGGNSQEVGFGVLAVVFVWLAGFWCGLSKGRRSSATCMTQHTTNSLAGETATTARCVLHPAYHQPAEEISISTSRQSVLHVQASLEICPDVYNSHLLTTFLLLSLIARLFLTCCNIFIRCRFFNFLAPAMSRQLSSLCEKPNSAIYPTFWKYRSEEVVLYTPHTRQLHAKRL